MAKKLKTTVDINGAKLKKILEDRFLTFSEVSVECGYNESAISRCIARNSMTKILIKALELRYNIRPEDYVIPDPKPEPGSMPEPPEQMSFLPGKVEIDYICLKSIIYEAVYDAVKKAWTE